MEQENTTTEIQEKDGFEEFENEIQRAKKKRREIIFEFALFFVLGFLLGVTIKTEAVKKITIGFNDYQIESGKERYDIASIKSELEREAVEQQKALEQAAEEQQVESTLE